MALLAAAGCRAGPGPADTALDAVEAEVDRTEGLVRRAAAGDPYLDSLPRLEDRIEELDYLRREAHILSARAARSRVRHPAGPEGARCDRLLARLRERDALLRDAYLTASEAAQKRLGLEWGPFPTPPPAAPASP